MPVTSNCALIGSRTSIWLGTDEFVPTASEYVNSWPGEANCTEADFERVSGGTPRTGVGLGPGVGVEVGVLVGENVGIGVIVPPESLVGGRRIRHPGVAGRG